MSGFSIHYNLIFTASESDIPIHTFSSFTKVSRSHHSSVSEYHTYNICNFATITYDGETAEKVCPTYAPIYRYGDTLYPLQFAVNANT